MDLKKDSTICYLQYFTSPLKTHRLKVKDWRKAFHANGNQNKADIFILISDTIDFQPKPVTKVII